MTFIECIIFIFPVKIKAVNNCTSMKIICRVIFALIDYTYTAVNNCTSMKIIHSIKVIKI